MFDKMKASWQILMRSLDVISRHKKLLLFPVFIGAFTTIATLFFMAPVVLQPTGYNYTQHEHWKAVAASVFTDQTMQDLAAHDPKSHQQTPVHLRGPAMAYGILLYFIAMFFATFFNTAFCSQIFSALKDGPVSIRAGIHFALGRWKEILYWSLLAGIVGLVIRRLESKFGIVGRWIVGLIGVAWSVASVFAIPVIVMEPETENPMEVLRTSALSIKKTWGEALIGFAGINLGGVVVLLLSGILLIGGVLVSFAIHAPLLIPFIFVLWFIAIFAYSYVSNVAGLVYQCALYEYARTGTPPAPYDVSMMNLGWKRKSS